MVTLAIILTSFFAGVFVGALLSALCSIARPNIDETANVNDTH